MKVRTNVKINLGLNVLRKRSDGYHDLETLFVPYFGYGDELEIEEAPSFSVDITPCDWDPQKDLTVRAYRLLAEDFSLPPVRISLRKGAPVGAGLGGGSADAAFALKCVNSLFSLGLSDDALASYASRLGSDCAFFVYNRPMIGEGRGEILTDFPLDLGGREIRVVVPSGVSVSTREAYGGIVPRCGVASALAAGSLPSSSAASGSLPAVAGSSVPGCPSGLLSDVAGSSVPGCLSGSLPDAAGSSVPGCLSGSLPDAAGSSVPGCPSGSLPDAAGSSVPGGPVGCGLPSLREALSLPVEQWRGRLVNDFETTVFKAHPELAALKEQLYAEGAVYASMSGSGSALFGIF